LTSRMDMGRGYGTSHTAKFAAEMCQTALCGGHPVILDEWGVAAHELLMSAFKFRDPIQVSVEVKTNNFPRLASKLLLRSHCRT